MKSKYSLAIEGEPGSYSAHVPELPTILVTGQSMEELTVGATGAGVELRRAQRALRSAGAGGPESSDRRVRMTERIARSAMTLPRQAGQAVMC